MKTVTNSLAIFHTVYGIFHGKSGKTVRNSTDSAWKNLFRTRLFGLPTTVLAVTALSFRTAFLYKNLL